MTPFFDIAGKYALLNKNEEIQLGRRVQKWLQWDESKNGPCPKSVIRSGRRARERFILCNLRLVIRICKGYTRRLQGTGLSFEDLLHEGVIGLTRAAEKYDSESGYAMSTYATWWIRQAVSRSIEAKGGIIKIGATPRRHLFKMQQVMLDGTSVEDAAAELGLNHRQLELVRKASTSLRVSSLDAAIEGGLHI